MKLYYNKAGEGSGVKFTIEPVDYEVFGSNNWKIVIYLVIAFVYLGIGFLLYRKCSGNAQSLRDNDGYISVN